MSHDRYRRHQKRTIFEQTKEEYVNLTRRSSRSLSPPCTAASVYMFSKLHPSSRNNNESTMILFLLILIHFLQIIETRNLRCYDDNNTGSFNLMEHCRACVIFIDIKVNISVSPRTIFLDNHLNLSEDRYHRHTDAVIHQRCAREVDGPLYGFDQTHCYCNSNLCNPNIQRCVYEIVSKRYFSCYHGSNASRHSLEIYKKCRSCRIRKDSPLTYHYECLTFGEQEQKNETECTCQQPMCNQDFAVCQRFQQLPSHARVNAIDEPTKVSNATAIPSTVSTTFNQTTEQEVSTENATMSEMTSAFSNETNTVQVEARNHAKSFAVNIFFYFLSLVCELRSFRQ